jgi:hypothetical protein
MTAAEIWPPQSSDARVITLARHAWSRPPSAADMAQARLFDYLLQNEIAELQQIAAGIEVRSTDRRELWPSKEIQRLNARINEVRRLLDALRDRFGAR